jgi:hypothetical protein
MRDEAEINERGRAAAGAEIRKKIKNKAAGFG